MAKRTSKKKSDFPLLDHIEKQMEKLRENVADAIEKFDEEAIHDARVATRRLKAALELTSPVLSKRHRKPLDSGLRKIRRRLGPLRDADVMIHHLSALTGDRRHGHAAAWLIGRLERARETLREESRHGPSVDKLLRRTEAWPMVRGEIVEAREGVDGLLAESLHTQADAFATQAEQLVREYVSGPRAAAGNHDDTLKPVPRQNPHDVRIAAKALRYTLEMAQAEGRSPGARVMTSFKRMQELLGTWHDFVVLADYALKEVVASELMHHEVATSDRVIELAKFAVKRSAQELSAFCRLWEQKGDAIVVRIGSLFELIRTVPGPESGGSELPLPESPRSEESAQDHPGVWRKRSSTESDGSSLSGDEIRESRTDLDPSGTGSSEVPEAGPTASRRAV